MIEIVRNELIAALRWLLPSFIHRCFQAVSPGAAFLDNWHIEAFSHVLEEVRAGRIKRLIITVPPRYLKSISVSIAFPAWLLGHDPTRRIVVVSYANDLSAKLSRDCRRIMEADWYREIFPRTRINPRKDTELEFETTQQGFRYATSVGGALTGRGGDVIIIDDPIKPGDAASELKRQSVIEWFKSTLYSRLDSKKDGVIIVVMQRVHEEDLVGYLLENSTGWYHLDLPVIAQEKELIPLGGGSYKTRLPGDLLHPEREPKEVLDDIKAQQGTYVFNAQYLQRPMPLEGNIVKWSWFQTYDFAPRQAQGAYVVQSWDTASKAGELNDYSACTTWLVIGNDYFLLDAFRDRLDYPSLRKEVIRRAGRFGPRSVLIEDKGSGTSLIQDLRRSKSGVRPVSIDPIGDKVTRMSSQSAKIEAGQVLLPRSAPWLDDFRAELLAFPYGKFDDQVDSVSQFLHWITNRPRFFTKKLRGSGYSKVQTG